MQTTNKISCNIIANLLGSRGIKDVVLSPGSRNAPLTVAFNAVESIRKHIVVDERAAAFMALGIAQASREPVVLVCTSGSAVLNYAPAVSEAYYRGIPLIVISADRPQEWIDQDDSQTIHQFEVLSNFVKKSYDIADIRSAEFEWYVNRTVNDAYIEATQPKYGPVHINVQLDAPLGRLEEVAQLPAQRVIKMLSGSQTLSPEVMAELIEQSKGKKILIVAGFMSPDNKLQYGMLKFEKIGNVAIMAETISNLHLSPLEYSIDNVLSTLNDEQRKDLRPDIVITLGGALVSRKIKEYLRELRPAQHWSVGFQHNTVDCFRALTTRIEVAPQFFFRRLANALLHFNDKSDYAQRWEEARMRASSLAQSFIENIEWSDIKAYSEIFKGLPDKINLHLSNGTSVRYNLLLAGKAFHTTSCNRGVSGIEGSTSTAVGAAKVSKLPTVLVTGDSSFFYDLSGLAIPQIPKNLKIIVINNSGGGIFRFVESTRNLPCREDFFCVRQTIRIEDLCKAFGLRYLCACNLDNLKKSIKELMSESDAATVLEVVTPAETSGEILSRFMNRAFED